MKPVKTPAIALSQNYSRETEENVSVLYEDISNMKKFHSTESYYSSSLTYTIPQQVTFFQEESTVAIIQEISEFSDEQIFLNRKNSINERQFKIVELNDVNEFYKFIDYLKFIGELFIPLIQFTLPSLPQFGIRVVSAEEVLPEVRTNFSQNIESKEPSKILNFTEKLSKPKRKKNSANFNETHVSISPSDKNDTEEKSTTEEIDNVSGGLYGDNFDYDDTPSSGVTEIGGQTEPIIDEVPKLNDTLINNMAVNITRDLNISAILQKIIDEELLLMNQQKGRNESLFEEKSLTHLYSESSNKPQTEFENKEIPPYYAIESPLTVELNEDSNNFTPELRNLDQKDDLMVNKNDENFKDDLKINTEESEIGINITDEPSDFDFDSLKIDPHDKNSMLQLGRFFKNIFADETSKGQTINFNLISQQNFPEQNQSLIEKNYIQRDVKLDTSTSSFSILPLTEDFKCQSAKSFSSTVKPENLQQSVRQVPVLVPFIQLFGSPQVYPEMRGKLSNSENGDNGKEDNSKSENEGKNKNIDGTKDGNEITNKNENNDKNEIKIEDEEIKDKNERKNGNHKQRSIDTNVKKNSQKSLFNIFKNLVKGVRIDIKETQLKSYMRRFVKEKFSNFDDFDKDSGMSWHKSFKKILDLLNGTAIRFHGERVRLHIVSFGYKKQPRNQETTNKVKFTNSKLIGKGRKYLPLEANQHRVELNDQPLIENDYSFLKNKLSFKRSKQRNTSEKEKKNSNDKHSLRNTKPLKNQNKVVKKSVIEEIEENPFSDLSVINFETKSAEGSTDFIRLSRGILDYKAKNKSTMVSVYFILKQQNNTLDSNSSLPILELHIRMPASSNPEKESSRAITPNMNDDHKSEETFEGMQKKKLNNNAALNYERSNDFIKNIISNVTSFRAIPDLEKKRQLLFLALEYLKHLTEKRKKKYFIEGEKNDYLNSKDDKRNILKYARQPMIYPEIKKRPITFNMVENELNPETGVFNTVSNFNYKMPLVRRQLQFMNPNSRFFTDYQEKVNKN